MNDRRQIFRQAALDRLASPDQIDRPLRVVGGAGWLALSVFLLGLAGFLVWVTTTTAPVKVKGRGIIIASGGLNQIVANTQGRLKTLAIRPGDHIGAGDIAATFEQTELGRELETVRAGLVDSRYRYAKLTDFYRESNRREEILEAERIDTIKQTRKLLQERLALLRKKQNSVSRLLAKKVITEDDLIEVQLQLSEARERLAKLNDEEKAIAIRKQERLSKQGLTLLDEQLETKQQERQVDRLKARFGEQLNLASRHAGRVVEVMVNPGDVVEPGKALATIAPADSGDARLTAFVYVNTTDGKRIRPGMQVEINPAAFRPEKYGYMLGRVEAVSELPATLDGMRRVLQNEQLARDLTKSGVPFELRVVPLEDGNTPSGYQWSSSRGPDAEINAGMLLKARVIVDRLHLINLLIPQFDGIAAAVGR